MDKQEQILKAALKLFAEFGFHGTPTSKIASLAGVSNGTLFHYYKTKDELVVALYVYIKTNMSACFDSGNVENETIKATFKRLFISTLNWAVENPDEFKFTQQFHNSPYEALLTNEDVQRHAGYFKELLKEAIETRVLKHLELDLVFTLITSHIYGINEYLISANHSDEKRVEIINQSFDLIWDMIT